MATGSPQLSTPYSGGETSVTSTFMTLHACKPKRRRKLPPIDLAVQPVRRLINPQAFKLTRQRFVAHPTLLDGIGQDSASELLPISPHLSLRPKPWRLLAGWEVLNWHSVAYWGGPVTTRQLRPLFEPLMLTNEQLTELFGTLGLPPKGRDLVLRARIEAPVRPVKSQGGNVITLLASSKMGREIRTESRHIEFAAVIPP